MTDTVILPTSADGLEIANGNSQTLVLDVLPEDYVAKKGDNSFTLINTDNGAAQKVSV